MAVASPKECAVKVLDLATGTVYFTFRDTAPPTRGHGIATLGGAGAAEVRALREEVGCLRLCPVTGARPS